MERWKGRSADAAPLRRVAFFIQRLSGNGRMDLRKNMAIKHHWCIAFLWFCRGRMPMDSVTLLRMECAERWWAVLAFH